MESQFLIAPEDYNIDCFTRRVEDQKPGKLSRVDYGFVRQLDDYVFSHKSGGISWRARRNPDNEYSLICSNTYLAGQGRGQADQCDAQEPPVYKSFLEKLRNHYLSVVYVDSKADILAAWYSSRIDPDDFSASIG